MMPFHKGARGEDIEIDRCWAFLDSHKIIAMIPSSLFSIEI